MEETISARPVIAPPLTEGIPANLKEIRRWMCWDYVWDGSKWTKEPMQAGAGQKNAASTRSKTWTTFDLAVASAQRGEHTGIGFALGNDKASGVTYSGVDLDDCVDGKGNIYPGALYHILRLPSYAEISPSGTGVHVLAMGELPDLPGRQNKEVKTEMYCSGRYFTVTGRHIENRPLEVVDCTKELALVHADLFVRIETPQGQPRKTDREIAVLALHAISPARAEDYYSWLNVGMALHSVSEDLYDEWESWSRLAPGKFSEEACQKKWRSFRNRGITLGSLICWAREDGWIWPPKGRTAPPLPTVPSRDIHETNGRALAPQNEFDPSDPHMGDGLTDQPGGGPWRLRKIQGVPPLYRLRSPIWEKSPELAREEGYITLSFDELASWPLIRKAAMTQADVYVRKDYRDAPVWENHGDTCLLRRLFSSMEKIHSTIDKNTTLSAAEFIIEKSLEVHALSDDNRHKIRGKAVSRFDNGDIVFRPRPLAALAKTSHPGISFENILAAAEIYGAEFYPRANGKQLGRFHRFTSEQVETIQKLLCNGHADDG